MKVFLVMWSECDSGYEILGAYLNREAAEVRVKIPTRRMNEYGAQMMLDTPRGGRWSPYSIYPASEQYIEEVEIR